MGWESFDVVRFDLRPLLQGQMKSAKLKIAYTWFNSDPIGLQCETNLQDIVDWQSSGPSRSNDGSLALVSCLTGGYKFASDLRCIGLVYLPL